MNYVTNIAQMAYEITVDPRHNYLFYFLSYFLFLLLFPFLPLFLFYCFIFLLCLLFLFITLLLLFHPPFLLNGV